jgi:predicted Zn finger-like uncharacterized protein
MKVTCNSCEQTFNVDETKASGSTFRVKCPACANSIKVNREEPAATNQSAPSANNVEEIVKREVEKAKREIFESMANLFGADIAKIRATHHEEAHNDYKRALICDPEQPMIDQITAVLKRLGYQVDSVKTSADAIKKLDQFTYRIITVGSDFSDAKDAAKILGRINGQKSSQRRQTFVVSISSTVKNTDATTAFLHGANIIVNKNDLDRLEGLIIEGQRMFQQIYHHFSAVLDEKDEHI